ncbi:MAG: 30S ribosome-binding factor RbfA [Clostridiales bacterium]|nr:30S ribosome-binding factor RbfA [Clostridiales bacterium]
MKSGGTNHRQERMARQIARDVSVIVDSLSDPRVHGVTVVDAEMSRDLRYATVFVTVDGNDEQVVKTLNGCSGYIRHVLAEENSEMRGVPQLKFVMDKTQGYYERIEQVIKGIHNESDND